MQSDYEVILGKDLTAAAASLPEQSHPGSSHASLPLAVTPSSALPPRVVLSQDGTRKENPYLTPPGTASQVTTEDGVDTLFGQSPAYQSYKKEKFEHRLMLWYRLQGHSVKETAALLGYTPQSVSQVSKQPWFIEAFCRMAKEHGTSAIQTMIEGAVIPAFQRLEDLAQNADSDAVKLAANKELIDRFLGKTVAKVETKVSGSIDQNIYDARILMEENNRIQKELAARGIGQHSSN
jgi:hypothetical protein